MSPSQGSQGAVQQGQVFSTTADRHLGMARHQARLGRLTPALESARQALGMAPQSAAAKALVAHLLLALGRAEEAAKRERISREEADRWAIRSHQRAITAQDAGTFTEEIVPIPVQTGKGGETFFALDEGPRRDTTLEKIAKLKPVYPVYPV